MRRPLEWGPPRTPLRLPLGCGLPPAATTCRGSPFRTFPQCRTGLPHHPPPPGSGLSRLPVLLRVRRGTVRALALPTGSQLLTGFPTSNMSTAPTQPPPGLRATHPCGVRSRTFPYSATASALLSTQKPEHVRTSSRAHANFDVAVSEYTVVCIPATAEGDPPHLLLLPHRDQPGAVAPPTDASRRFRRSPLCGPCLSLDDISSITGCGPQAAPPQMQHHNPNITHHVAPQLHRCPSIFGMKKWCGGG